MVKIKEIEERNSIPRPKNQEECIILALRELNDSGIQVYLKNNSNEKELLTEDQLLKDGLLTELSFKIRDAYKAQKKTL